MTEGLERRDIVTQTSLQRSTFQGPPEPVEDAITGVDFDSITFVANGANFNAALAGAGSNALLVAYGGAANFAPTALLPNQTLLGGGGLLPVRSRVSGIVLTYAAPGSRPTFESLGVNGAAIALANNAHVKNVTILGDQPPTGAPTNPIPGQKPVPINPPSPIPPVAEVVIGSNQTVVLEDVSITNTQAGVSLSGTGSSVILRNSTISLASFGIVVGGEDNTVVMQNNVFRDIGINALNISENSQGTTSNSVTAIGNSFAGNFGSFLFSFGVGNAALTAGSTGNADVTTASGGLCTRDVTTVLSGSIAFVGGLTVDQSSCTP